MFPLSIESGDRSLLTLTLNSEEILKMIYDETVSTGLLRMMQDLSQN
jgi:hypothetical protein